MIDAAALALEAISDAASMWHRYARYPGPRLQLNERQLERLLARIENPVGQVGMGALARILGRYKYKVAFEALNSFLSNKNGGYLVCAAAWALGAIADKRAVNSLVQVLSRDDPAARSVAAASLGHIRDEQSVDALLHVLSDRASDVRQAAARALGEIKSERAVDALVGMLRDDD